MVALKDVNAANARLSSQHSQMTAVFVGATSGIGLATIKAFATHIPQPKAIIVGRKQSKFQPELDNLRNINPAGEYVFLEAEVSLLRNIDRVCAEIKSHVSKIDLLLLAQGYVNFGGRDNNAEGLDNSCSLRYYGRVRFTQNLLPSMSANARTISVLAGGKEGKMFPDDMDLEKNYSAMNVLQHFTTLMTLSFDRLAEQNPDKSFIHIYPGFVDTGSTGKHNTGVTGVFIRWVEWLTGFFMIRPEDAGARMLYCLTNATHARGSWSLDWDCTPKTTPGLKECRETGMIEKTEEHTMHIFEKIIDG